MDDVRQDPDKLLEAIRREEDRRTGKARGHLKIFFGYAAGVGKTFAMLDAAQAARKRGTDIVVAYVEPHARPDTMALLHGLEQVPVKEVEHHGMTLRELDLDAVLDRDPQVAVVDELAHANAEGCRHAKRYQDVEELLEAGIDVFTTLNVQHIESLNDMVASITGVLVRERVPDSVFDDADQVELIDIEPQDLLERLREGKVYRGAQAERAAANFFTEDNLTALREIALRRCADRVNLLAESARIKTRGEYHTDEHILLCLSGSSSNARVIRTAARMASAYRGEFTALYVETPDYPYMEDDEKQRLRGNMRLAQQLGAKVETTYGDDVPFQISEFARLSGVSQIVIGQGRTRRLDALGPKSTFADKVIDDAVGIEVHVVPDSEPGTSAYRFGKAERRASLASSAADALKCLAALALSCLAGFLFDALGFAEANIILIFVLGVLVTSVMTQHRAANLISALVSVLAFDFLFTEPRFTLYTYDPGYPVTFLIMFLVAFFVGSLADRLKELAQQSSSAAYRTKVLFDTDQLLQKADSRDRIAATVAGQLVKLLGRDVVVYLEEDGLVGEPRVFTAVEGAEPDPECTSVNERAVAQWTLANNKHAGATTDTLPDSECLYLAIRVNSSVYGVVGIRMGEEPLDSFENSILLSILGECALALENERNAREAEEAAVAARNEQLRANLLRAISHDLRTPLTSISGDASNLLVNGEALDRGTREQLYLDIYDDSTWLTKQVEDILTLTRIGEGRLDLGLTDELVADVVDEALLHVNRGASEHVLSVEHDDDLLLARMDPDLIVRVLINIVDNSIKYTPAGSHICISTHRDGGDAVFRISDDGPGMPDEVKEHAFDMFYTGGNGVSDGARSLGLGLTLCKSIIDIHGGGIEIADNDPHGAVTTFTLPASDVIAYGE